jgi:branched-chain amino acid transport system permease protein
MTLRLQPTSCAYLLTLVCAAGGVFVFGDGYAWRIAALVGVYATAAIGFQLIFGRLGLLMLAQGALFGIGAYASAMIGVHAGVDPWVGVMGAILAGGFVALAIAGPVARLDSHYVALATLALAQLALLAATHGGTWTGGSNGLYGVPPLSFGGFDIVDGPALALVSWSGVMVALVAAHMVTGGAAKARHATIREAPLVAASLGIDAARARLILFPVAGGMAALAGAFQAHGLGVVSPAVLRFDVMITLLAIAVIGGRGSAGGAVAAACLLVPLPEVFRGLESYYLVAYGAALLVVMVALPGGIDGLIRRAFADTPSACPEPVSLNFSRDTLTVEGLSKAFGGNRALDGLALHLEPGSITGLIGPNGSGKTTALNLMSGIERADAGVVRLGDRDLSALSAVPRARAGLARSYQHPVFPKELNVLDAVSAGAATLGQGRAALDLVGLAERHATPVEALGPGEARLLDLARALATEPSVLLLDEPAAGLTEVERARLSECLQTLRRDGLAILVVEHRMDFLMAVSDTVACLVAGELVALGTPAEIRANPRVRAAYLGREVAS